MHKYPYRIRAGSFIPCARCKQAVGQLILFENGREYCAPCGERVEDELRIHPVPGGLIDQNLASLSEPDTFETPEPWERHPEPHAAAHRGGVLSRLLRRS